jgi:hypothetical protein
MLSAVLVSMGTLNIRPALCVFAYNIHNCGQALHQAKANSMTHFNRLSLYFGSVRNFAFI